MVDAFADYHWDLLHLLANGRRVSTQELVLYRLAEHSLAEVWVTADKRHVIDQLL